MLWRLVFVIQDQVNAIIGKKTQIDDSQGIIRIWQDDSSHEDYELDKVQSITWQQVLIP